MFARFLFGRFLVVVFWWFWCFLGGSSVFQCFLELSKSVCLHLAATKTCNTLCDRSAPKRKRRMAHRGFHRFPRNHALIFSRGNMTQCVDANQGGTAIWGGFAFALDVFHIFLRYSMVFSMSFHSRVFSRVFCCFPQGFPYLFSFFFSW